MDNSAKGTRLSGKERAALTESLRRKYDKGASIRALAAEIDRSYGFVHRVLTEAGVTLRGRGGATRGRAKAA